MADSGARILVCTQQCPQGQARGDGDDGAALVLLQAVIGELDRCRLWTSVSVEFKGCPSPCERGPALLIYPEGVLYDGVTPAALPAIIDRHFPSREPSDVPLRRPVAKGAATARRTTPQRTGMQRAARPSRSEGHRGGGRERKRIGAVPPPADDLLARARAAWRDVPAATVLLAQALAIAPDCLPLHHARYKFHSSHGQYALAEAAARTALAEAARQAGLPSDWRALDHGVDPAINWADVQGAAHFYLFTLKALAYLRLRRGDLAEAGAVLDTLARLDPGDGVGAAVTRSLLQGAADAA